MKSKKQVLADNPTYKTLINAVVSRIGLDSVSDVNRHGINGGFSGFISYHETREFYTRYRAMINRMVKEMAKGEFNEAPVKFVGNFACLGSENEYEEAIGELLYGAKINAHDDDHKIVCNALAWFAAEEVCRMFED